MSRVGKKPVPVPNGVEVSVSGRVVCVQGPKGQLDQHLPDGIRVSVAQEPKAAVVTCESDAREVRACQGLTRSLIANMVTGVVDGYAKGLEVVGVGYNVRMQGKTLVMQIGFANAVEFPIPEGIEVEIQSATNPGRMVVRGCDKQLVGQVAASIRDARPPEPYQGKGIRYADEVIRRKAGKAFTTG